MKHPPLPCNKTLRIFRVGDMPSWDLDSLQSSDRGTVLARESLKKKKKPTLFCDIGISLLSSFLLSSLRVEAKPHCAQEPGARTVQVGR